MTPSTRRSHTPKGRAARAKVFRAAERLLAAHGFHGTSMRDVADQAGVPLASALYHFARKEALHAAVLGAIAEELEARIASALTNPGSYGERLDALVRALVAWAAERPSRVRLLLFELLDNSKRLSRAARLPLSPALRAMTDFVEEGLAGGHLRRVGSAETAVLHVVGALSYVVAARPTVDRMVGEARARALADSYQAEAITFAKRALGSE